MALQQTALSETLPLSIVIPSYRGGGRLLRLVESLLSCEGRPLDLVVVVDEPEEGVVEELSRLCAEGRCRLIVRRSRSGKVSALNEALPLVGGDVVLFLDDDVAVEDPLFLKRVAKEMEGCDIADIKKVVVGRGLLAGLVYMEYVAYNFASKLMAKLAGRTIAVNGAAFAAKREALQALGGFRRRLSEDFDLALRAFLLGLRFKYIDSTYVLNYAPSSWGKWLKQRKRWAVALASWLKENWRALLSAARRMPHVLIPGLIASLPSLVTTGLALALYNQAYAKAAYAILVPVASLLREALPFAALFTVTLHVAYAVTTLALALVVALLGLLHVAIARYVRMRSRAHLLPIYLLFYQPLWLTVILAGLVRVLLLGNEKVDDWVV
ncbi:MAG: glycosyltransferase family 2 protein [Thermofilum sp.]|jgi:cellulose synthase/poly-beta-1,6-N-acetylglucosamine synthase-like glycosyltransferase|nr:glycosyltransferase family 2 protein [Thermofilum sp.]